MTNDAKLGMVAGVLGVIVAGVLLTSSPPQTAQSQPEPNAQPPPVNAPAIAPAPGTAVATAPANTPPEANTAALPSTPVARTRKDVDAQPASRPGGLDEEP